MEVAKLTTPQLTHVLNNGFMEWVAFGMEKTQQPESVAEATHAIEDGITRFQTGDVKGFYEDVIFAIDPQRRSDYMDRQPWCAVLMCSDSTLSPETVLDTSSRNLYVVRTAGNSIDSRTIASLEHGLETYPIKVLVIIGHEGCSTINHACGVGTKEMTGSIGENVRYLLPSVVQARGRNPKLAEQRDDKGKRIVDAKLLKYAVEFSITNVKNDILARSDTIRHMVNRKRLDILCYMHNEEFTVVDVIPRNRQGDKDEETSVSAPKKSPEKKNIKQQTTSGDESDNDVLASPPVPYVAPGLAALAAVAIASPPKAKRAGAIAAKSTIPPPRTFAPASASSRAVATSASPRAAAAARPVLSAKKVASSPAPWYRHPSLSPPAKRVGRPPASSTVQSTGPMRSTPTYAAKRTAASAVTRASIPSRPTADAPRYVVRKRSASTEPDDALRPKRRIIANKDPFYEYL
eukprot:TRINITY_DN7036_c0_g1_i1.p1 TRINITY_DN7036_c0_g1~~TRINITY_DN7036_c0_g1_i1.p1  ORF type:complete len:470 (+),score=82.46 TRINITY_DN7036_c0_g1_i1:27-1412(+)